MISKEEGNQLQKITSSVTPVHSAAADTLSREKIIHSTEKERPSESILIVDAVDNEVIWTKTIL